MMNQLSNAQLLEIFLGEGGNSLSKHSLAELFGLRAMRQSVNVASESVMSYVIPDKFRVARELLRRAMEENLHGQSIELNSPSSVKEFLKLHLGGKEREYFVAIWLDTQHKVIAIENLFQGTLTQTSVYLREVVKGGLKFNASAVIFCHNHPSGAVEPSSSDQTLTSALKQALGLIDIRVIDHFIVGENAIMSFAERGLI